MRKAVLLLTYPSRMSPISLYFLDVMLFKFTFRRDDQDLKRQFLFKEEFFFIEGDELFNINETSNCSAW
ncbi:MAG TPA: hypothetical protein DDW50_11080 [Firmicutes bacterium]|nr:hypothetical protein [Bacillota bacterium]